MQQCNDLVVGVVLETAHTRERPASRGKAGSARFAGKPAIKNFPGHRTTSRLCGAAIGFGRFA